MNSVAPPINEQLEEQVEDNSTKKTRGTTQMPKVHARKERKLILLNGKNKPVGPTDEVVTELSSFLGTLARTATLFPFDIFHWRDMSAKNNLWDYTKEKYIIPDAAKGWTLTIIRDAWRRHRRQLKLSIMTHMTMMKFTWQRNPVIFQNVSLKSSSSIGNLRNSRKCLKQILRIEKS